MTDLIRRLNRLQRLLLGGALLALVLFLVPASPAHAIEYDDGSGSLGDETVSNLLSTSNDRTLNRWKDAASGFHSQFDGFVGTQLIEQAERNLVQGGYMAAGNTFYKITSDMTQFAVNLDVIDGIGSAMDGIVKVFLEALIGVTGATGGGILFGAIVVIVLVLSVFRNARYGMARMFREIGAIAIVVAVVFGLGAAALNHNPGSGKYDPAPGTPGWAVKSVNDGITWLAATPAQVFTNGVEGAVWGNEIAPLGGELGCAAYLDEMQNRFEARTVEATSASGASMVSIATVMDSLWDSTGMRAWAQTQAGYSNDYTDKVFCRILDFRSGSSPALAARLTYGEFPYQGGHNSDLRAAVETNALQRAPFAPSSPKNTTASIVAWAACNPTGFSDGRVTWSWESGWENYWGGIEMTAGAGPRGERMGDKDANTECHNWWTAERVLASDGQSVEKEQEIPNVFHVKGDRGWITDRAKDADGRVFDFLNSLTGMNVGNGSTATAAYAGGAFFTMLAFGIIAIIVMVAKLFAAMFILALWFVLIGAMFSPANMKDRLLKTGQKFLGTAVFAAMTTLILTFVVVFTRALIRIGMQLWGVGEIGSMIWAGAAPVLALILVHLMFTKVFKLPSPISLRGAQAWSKASVSGAAGAAVGSGIGSYVGSRLGSAAKGAGRKLGNAALSKVSGGRVGTPVAARSSMAPAGKGPKAAVGETTKLSSELQARVASGEQLTKSEQKLVAADAAIRERGDVQRTNQLAAEAAADQKKADRADLRQARKDHLEQFGVAAPGDLRSAAAQTAGQVTATAAAATAAASRRAASAVGGKALDLGDRIAGATGLTALRGELASRKAARQMAIDARAAEPEDRERLQQETLTEKSGEAAEAKNSIDTVQASDSGKAKRAALGVSAQPSSATLIAAPAGAAALAAAAGTALTAPAVATKASVSGTAVPSVPAHTPAALGAPAPAPSVPANPAAVLAPAAPAWASLDPASITSDLPVRSIPVPMTTATIGSTTGPERSKMTPVARTRDLAPEETTKVQAETKSLVERVADVLTAPNAAADALRRRGAQAKSTVSSKVDQVVNTKAVRSMRTDATIIGAIAGAKLQDAKRTRPVQAAEKTAQRAATIAKASARRAGTGASAVLHSKRDSAEVLAAWRAHKAAAEALAKPLVEAPATAAVPANRAPGAGSDSEMRR